MFFVRVVPWKPLWLEMQISGNRNDFLSSGEIFTGVINFKGLRFHKNIFLSPTIGEAIKETKNNFYWVGIILVMRAELLSSN